MVVVLTQGREGEVSEGHFVPVHILADGPSAGEVVPENDAPRHVP